MKHRILTLSALALSLTVAIAAGPRSAAASGGFTKAGAMVESRSNHSATLLADGRLPTPQLCSPTAECWW
jgi:hypothetical protein